jgi:hypothetical protein
MRHSFTGFAAASLMSATLGFAGLAMAQEPSPLSHPREETLQTGRLGRR